MRDEKKESKAPDYSLLIPLRPSLPLDTLPPRVYPGAMTTELNITGMSCGHCVKAVEGALKAVPGVQDVRVDLEGGRATVEGQAEGTALIAAVTEEGYGATVAAGQ